MTPGNARRGRAAVRPASGDALLAEIGVAQHLLRADCQIARDVPLPSGRTADFRVERDGVTFHLHVKWLANPLPLEDEGVQTESALERHRDRIPRKLRALESIARPIEVAIRWAPGASSAALARIVREATPFLRAARISEERIVRDARGREIGAVRVVGPRSNRDSRTRLRLIDELEVMEHTRRAGRIMRLLRKAHAQFMPRSLNVILVTGAESSQSEAVDTALMGSVVERWDRFPQPGQRVAYGRADDGFWSKGRASTSTVVAWLWLGDRANRRGAKGNRSALWIRNGARIPEEAVRLLEDLFEP